MSAKTKTNTLQDSVGTAAQQLGILLMTAATTLGMFELPEHPDKRIVLGQAKPAFAEVMPTENGGNPLRREREETGPHYISYSVAQRTPGRTGKY